jgi:hypothetical protein
LRVNFYDRPATFDEAFFELAYVRYGDVFECKKVRRQAACIQARYGSIVCLDWRPEHGFEIEKLTFGFGDFGTGRYDFQVNMEVRWYIAIDFEVVFSGCFVWPVLVVRGPC